MNWILVGLLAAIPLSLCGIIYMLLRGRSLVAMLKSGSETDAMTDQQWYYLMLGTLALAPFLFGMMASLVYSWIGKPLVYLGVAVGLAVLFSIIALRSNTPARTEKTVMNFMVALDYGLLIPFLSVV
jgi:hypothetical protein